MPGSLLESTAGSVLESAEGYLRSIGVQANNASDALEQMLAHLSGGEASARYYYIVDRREHLQKVKALQMEKPRARAAGR
jgi:hypothetical protein